ncbi:Metallo-beta-lactamase superfamily enzyme [Prochlorococcus marinus str. MIT 9515]|uniref:Ribonuclease Z n=1 Tax=Prochlorococcus marinus (strain MIT 9515) TaxID=167542 RepID=RNZ_PROM5|nr:ribonuclease Z [Prochlorococcus marinus]A2BY56.1 RecName: Full=Ribonuclease Z; Short=RNase Z; AltName: Full=tRNA 3 endonuclease; AltName: Full=tRNase Z [Prochlorococcus marinus str. MIT 9515]ABM72717.1 Metallo-beta-lactamase superfamily enzyme [Prochlorococcus marinus str. MIT 9515]
MNVTFLGTSSGVPTLTRNVSSLALKLSQTAEVWLFDCGEGTQHQLMKSNIKSSQIKKIFITHMHGDHIYGLPGLLATLGLSGNSNGIELYGPSELKFFVLSALKSSYCKLSFPLRFKEVEDKASFNKILFENDKLKVHCACLKHRLPAYGYRVSEKDKPGIFDIKKATDLNIPPGPIYSELQAGKTVKLKDGRSFNGQEFCGPPRKGESFVYCTDTVFSESAINLSKNADLLVHESTFSKEDEKMAYEKLHSTTIMAAKTALLANAKKLIITHISPRYTQKSLIKPSTLLLEAQKIFPNTYLAKDFLTAKIK